MDSKSPLNLTLCVKVNNLWWTVSLHWTWLYVCPGAGVLKRLAQMCSLQGKQTAGSAAKGFKLEPWDHESPLLHWRNLRQHLRGPMPGPWGTKAWLGCGSTAHIMKSPAQSLLSVHLITELCPTLCDSMDCSPPGSSVQGETPGKNTTVGCHGLLQGVFPTPGLNSGLPRHRQIL